MDYQAAPEDEDANAISDAPGIEYEERQKKVDSQVINRVSSELNRIYGKNGESYQVPINAAHLSAFETFIRYLFDTDDVPYEIYKRNGIERVVTLKMARHMKMLPAYARIGSPSLAFPPDFDLFFSVYRTHEIRLYGFVDWEMEDDFRTKGAIDFIDPKHAHMAVDFVLTVRKEAKKTKLRSRMSDWRSACRRNEDYLRNFLIEMFEEHGRVNAVDVVFLYRKAACENRGEVLARGIELQQRNEEEYQKYLNGTELGEVPDQWVSLQELKNDLKNFFNNARHKTSLFGKDKFIDYFARIEYTRDAGYHVHICFFYKGSEVQRDLWYSHAIGKFWQKITDGRGYYFSCNAKAAEGKYRNVGIGAIEHYDFEKIRHLWTAVSYFVKAATVVRVKHNGKQQMVLHGKRRKHVGAKLGRPRGEGLSGPEYREKLRKIFS